MSGDYRDIVIGEFAASESALVERLVDVTLEREAYRELAQAAIQALHSLTRERDRLRATHHRLLDAYRHGRTQSMPDADGEAA